MTTAQKLITIARCAAGTMATRFLPFLMFSSRRPTPAFIRYLGKALPGAVFGMLVIYCLRNVSFVRSGYGIPELAAVAVTALLHVKKRQMLLSHGVALWDSIAQCDITCSSDASIDNVVPNDLSPIFEASEIRQVFCNGKKSWEMYHKYIEPVGGMPAICLPSTSPANAAWTLEKLCSAWSEQLLPFLAQKTVQESEKKT